MAVVLNLSFYVLMQYPPFKEAVKLEDKEAFENILYQAGIDVEAGYQIVTCEHRPIEGNPLVVNCPRVEGVERQDEEWLSSPLCSWDAKREAIRDPELRADLIKMKREGSVDMAFVSDNAAKAAIRKQKGRN